MNVAIIGAGLSGLMAANDLKDRGAQVTLFDKGRTVGGRCATRTTPFGPIDHGLQLLDGNDPRILRALKRFKCDVDTVNFAPGAYQPIGKPGPYLAPRKGALSFAQAMASNLSVLTSHTVQSITLNEHTWQVTANDQVFDGFKSVIFAIPPQQAAAFALHGPDLDLGKAGYTPQSAVLAASNKALLLPETGPLDIEGLAWISKSSDHKRAVILTSEPLSSALMETEKDEIAQLLWERIGGGDAPHYLKGHRWRYCRVNTPMGTPSYWDSTRNLGFCGDWFVGPNAGDAFESGTAIAAQILDCESR